MHKRRLELAKPCTKSWSKMAGTNMVRHCTSCSKDVFNLSMLTEREAEAALAVRPDEVCVIYYTKRSGQVIFYPEAPVRHATGRMLAAALTASALAACSPSAPVDLDAPPAAIASDEASAATIATSPTVEAQAVAAPTLVATEGECASDWEKSFDKQGRSDLHTRQGEPKPGGLRRLSYEEEQQLNPLNKLRIPQTQPDRRVIDSLPSRDEVVAAFSALRGAISSCKGPGVAFADTEFSGKSGRVTRVAVTGVPARAAACVAKAVRQAKVPKFTSKTYKVKYPFKLKG
jgi:hypothetical protein